MNFIAMDFETANSKRYSAVSVAVVVVRDNKIVDKFYSLLKPPVEFNQKNIKIHGIYPKDVENAPIFPLVWQEIKQFYTNGQLVVAHNASFDNSVLKSSLEYYHLKMPHYLSLDTVKTSRYLYPQLTNYKLNTVSEALGISLKHHHYALDDTVATAQIILIQAKKFGVESLKNLVTVM